MPVSTEIGSCPVDSITPDSALTRLSEAISNDHRLLVAPVNAATVVEASSSAPFRAALNEMDLLIPDGHWLQHASRLLGKPSTGHVPTVPLTFQLLKKEGARHVKVYLLGARRQIVAAAAEEVPRRFPGVEIVGARDGYFSQQDEVEILRAIHKAKPELLLIGISSPKREFFMARHRQDLAVPVVIGVGGLIDILGGATPEGPPWLRDYGLMWLYRFAQEPRRLWNRYTIVNIRFICLVVRQALNEFFGRSRPFDAKS